MKFTLVIVTALLVLALARPDRGGDRRPRPKPRPDDDKEDGRKPRPRPDDDKEDGRKPRPRPRPDDDDRRPRPKPRGPMIFARRGHKAAKGEPLNFKFAVASVSDEDKLDQDKVAVLKVSRGEDGPVFSKTDFKIELKTLDEKEIEEYYEKMKSKIEEKKKEMKGDEKERDSEKESRRPKFKQTIVGEVNVKEVDCDDFSKYMIVYGDASALKEAKKGGSRPSVSGFIIFVEGCDEEPKPVPDNDDDDEKPKPKPKRSADKEGGRNPSQNQKDLQTKR